MTDLDSNLHDIRTAKSKAEQSKLTGTESSDERRLRQLYELVMDKLDEIDERSKQNQRTLNKLLKRLRSNK